MAVKTSSTSALWPEVLFSLSSSRKNTLQINTSISALRWPLKLAVSLTKSCRLRCTTAGTTEVQFFRSDTQRYCRMAKMNLSLERKVGPAFSRIPSKDESAINLDCRATPLPEPSADVAPSASEEEGLEPSARMLSLHRARKRR